MLCYPEACSHARHRVAGLVAAANDELQKQLSALPRPRSQGLSESSSIEKPHSPRLHADQADADLSLHVLSLEVTDTIVGVLETKNFTKCAVTLLAKRLLPHISTVLSRALSIMDSVISGS